MLSFRPLRVNDFPLLLTWLATDHAKQWWNDGDDILEKIALHYGAEEPDVARFILIKFAESGESSIGYFQYYIVSKEVIGIDQFIGEIDQSGNRHSRDQIIFRDDRRKTRATRGHCRSTS